MVKGLMEMTRFWPSYWSSIVIDTSNDLSNVDDDGLKMCVDVYI